MESRAVARALIGGGGGGGVYSYIRVNYARLISFEINLKTTDFKRNPLGITRVYEYCLFAIRNFFAKIQN